MQEVFLSFRFFLFFSFCFVVVVVVFFFEGKTLKLQNEDLHSNLDDLGYVEKPSGKLAETNRLLN